MNRTEKRLYNRNLVAKQLKAKRIAIENRIRGKTGHRDVSFTNDLMLSVCGDTTQASRSVISALETGSIECKLVYFYKYYQALGLKDSEIKEEFLRIIKLLK